VKHRFRRRLLYTLLVFADRFFLLLPYGIAIKLGGICGSIVYVFLGRYRNLAIRHLHVAFNGVMTQKQAKKIARSVFMNLGMGLAEILSLPKIKKRLDEIIDIEGIEKIDKILSAGQGAIILSAHLGNWEFIPMYFAGKGYPSNIVARPIYYEKYNEWVSLLRNGMGVNIIYRTDSPRKIIRLLKEGQLIGIVADQDIDNVDGVFIDFFGQKAYTPSGPVKLARSVGAPIIPMFIIRDGLRHKIFVEDPISIDKTTDSDWVVTYTQKWSNVVESYIKRYPGQWVWMHKRWKTRQGDTPVQVSAGM
jgi:Kdo2-lipid IVA lauroyltransferase/acyltransferase